MKALPIALLCALLPTLASAGEWGFTDVTSAAGVEATHGLEFGYFGEPDMMSGGAAAGDVNGDGWPDLFVLRGTLGPAVLFINNGDGSFSEGAAAANLAISSAAGVPNGAVFADFSGDGALDLVIGGVYYGIEDVSGLAPLRLFVNDGSGVFIETTGSAGVSSDRNSWSVAFADYDRDGDLDFAVGRWTKGSNGQNRSGQLWRNLGDGTFEDASVGAGVAPAFAAQDFSFTPNFADIDDDGWPDLLFAGDFHTSRIFRNQGDGTFADITALTTGNLAVPLPDENGMGAAVADYDNDGHLDWFVSSIIDADGTVENGNWGVTGNKLYRGNGDGSFTEVAEDAGVEFGDWGWGSCFADFNNDGHADLFHVNGMDLPPGAGEDQFHNDPARLFVNQGDGSFTEQGAARGAADTGQGRGVICFDYDADGDIDLYINNGIGTGRLLRNDGGNTAGGFLQLQLAGNAGNRHGIGARVTVTTAAGTQTREVQAGNHYLSGSPSLLHFGLGDVPVVSSLQVRWPDGQLQTLANVGINQRLTLGADDLFADGFESATAENRNPLRNPIHP